MEVSLTIGAGAMAEWLLGGRAMIGGEGGIVLAQRLKRCEVITAWLAFAEGSLCLTFTEESG